MKIINLSQFPVSEELINKGVFESASRELILQLLTFDVLPNDASILVYAKALAITASVEEADAALINVPHFLTSALESALLNRGVLPVYLYCHQTEGPTDASGEKGETTRSIYFVPAIATQEMQQQKEWNKTQIKA